MKQFFLLTLLAILLTPLAAHADGPPPAGTKFVDPHVRFLGIEKHGSYIFFLSYSVDNNPRFTHRVNVPVENDTDFAVSGRIVSQMTLIAVTRQDFAKLEKDKPSLAWIDQKNPGVLMANVPAPSNTAYTFNPWTPVSEYRVSIEAGNLFVDEVVSLRGWAIGSVCAVSLAGLGIWYARRRRSPPTPPLKSPEREENHAA